MNINNLHLSSESEQLLISFLDGELSLEKEQELFSQLAINNNDIRSSMRELLAIRSAVQMISKPSHLQLSPKTSFSLPSV